MSAMQRIERSLRRMLAGIGAVLVLALFGLTTAFLVNACTGSQTAGGVEVVKAGAPFLPGPAGPVIAIAAEKLDAAVAAYLDQHPEKRNEKWGVSEWGSVIGLGLFGGGLRRKAADLVSRGSNAKLPIPHA